MNPELLIQMVVTPQLPSLIFRKEHWEVEISLMVLLDLQQWIELEMNQQN